MLITAIIDKLIPAEENPHEVRSVESEQYPPDSTHKLMHMGVFTALAIAIHNVPEGIAVSVPIYQATGSRKKPLSTPFSPILQSRWARSSDDWCSCPL